MAYAENTTVPSDRSRAEIEKTLIRYGASGFMYGWHHNSATIAFEMKDRKIKFVLPLPSREDYRYTPAKQQERSNTATDAAYDQAVRQKWRALALCIKAKLEAIDSGITEFDDEFLAHIVLHTGETVGDLLKPQIALSYQSGKMPPLLPAPGAAA